MGVLEYSVWIKAAPEQVWDTYVDPTRIPDWQTGKPVIEDVQGAPGEPGSTYVSKRGPLAARTTVLTAEVPRELVTRTDAYFGLQFEVTSRLSGRSGGTDLRASCCDALAPPIWVLSPSSWSWPSSALVRRARSSPS